MSEMKLLTVLMMGVCVFYSLAQGIGGQVVPKLSCKKEDLPTGRLSVKLIQSYSLQTTPIKYVMFTTKLGDRSCADPKLEWVKKAMAELDKREELKRIGVTKKPAKKAAKKATKKPRRKPKKN